MYNKINDNSVYLNTNNCDFGIGYNQASLNINLSSENKTYVETRAFNFIKKLL